MEQAVQLGSVRLNLFDTAGVREVGADGDAIEAEGIRRSWRKLDEAGLVLAVFDAAQPLSDDDLELARRCQGRPAIAVLNKQDLAGETDVPRGTLEPYFKKIVPMCARDAVGLQALTDAVADLLGTAQLDQRLRSYAVPANWPPRPAREMRWRKRLRRGRTALGWTPPRCV